jgi:glycosyltransferase involved in cell wall biosynthesis
VTNTEIATATGLPMPGGNIADDRPGVALINNSQTPYRLHLHLRIAREMPEIKLWSVFTHEVSNAPWAFQSPPEIGPVSFGQGESSGDVAKVSNVHNEWRKGGRIIRWLKEHDIKAIVVAGYNDVGRLRIMRWASRAGMPCFLFADSNIRGDLATGSKAIVKLLLVSRVLRWCTGVMPCGSLGRDYFLKYGADPNRIFYFPYEPDYDLIRGITDQEIATVRDRYRLSAQRRRFVFSGRLASAKRPDLLVQAFAAVAKARPDWDLVVIGSGPLRETVEAMVPAELIDRVRWTGFLDDQRTISAIYRASDVLVLPSDFEPWALVINEATAAGLAIVTTDIVGAAAELVRSGINGQTIPPGDAGALTTAMLAVSAPDTIDRMKAASPALLADWTRRADPINGLRRALQATGVISNAPKT